MITHKRRYIEAPPRAERRKKATLKNSIQVWAGFDGSQCEIVKVLAANVRTLEARPADWGAIA